MAGGGDDCAGSLLHWNRRLDAQLGARNHPLCADCGDASPYRDDCGDAHGNGYTGRFANPARNSHINVRTGSDCHLALTRPDHVTN